MEIIVLVRLDNSLLHADSDIVHASAIIERRKTIMSNNRLYATTTAVADIASQSLANYNTMAEVIVYPGMSIHDNFVCATDGAYDHAVKTIQRSNRRFLRRDEPFAITGLPIRKEDGFHIVDVYIPYTPEYAIRVQRVRKGLFNFIHTSVRYSQ